MTRYKLKASAPERLLTSSARMKMRLFTLSMLPLTALLCLAGCAKEQKEDASTLQAVTPSDAVAEVTVMRIEPKNFTYDLVSNGKAEAGEYVDLRFDNASGAVIDRIAVRNGQRVSRGQVIAELDRFKLENAVSTARNTLEKSKLDLADALIGQGHDPEKPSAIPDDVMRLARLRSGVAQAEVQLSEAERELADATLRAPFDGTVANLFQKAGNRPDGSQPLCRVIASKGMEVTFPVLESELPLVRTGDAVEVMPYSSDKSYSGRVSSVNPIVDKDGMVKVYATVNGGAGLYDGMNVRIVIKRDVEEALAVPKSAVVLRSGGRKVVFTHKDGKAMWNYVTTSLENMNEYVITEGLEPGQEVIVSGNINLAHEAPVKVIKD